jgi:protein-S-isoprenylcysteine O-methyltransferase Ste14
MLVLVRVVVVRAVLVLVLVVQVQVQVLMRVLVVMGAVLLRVVGWWAAKRTVMMHPHEKWGLLQQPAGRQKGRFNSRLIGWSAT